MCYGKIVRNTHSRVEQFLLSSRAITACLRLPLSINQWFSTFFAEESHIQIYDLVRESH